MKYRDLVLHITKGVWKNDFILWIWTPERMPTFGWYHERRQNKITYTDNYTRVADSSAAWCAYSGI